MPRSQTEVQRADVRNCRSDVPQSGTCSCHHLPLEFPPFGTVANDRTCAAVLQKAGAAQVEEAGETEEPEEMLLLAGVAVGTGVLASTVVVAVMEMELVLASVLVLVCVG